MGKSAERTDPELWEKVKKEISRSSKGGRPGQWSARKAQIAVQVYRERGGGYRGAKPADNALQPWQDEGWSVETGEHYLPKAAREQLSDGEDRRTSEKKRADSARGEQHSAQPPDAKTARHRGDGSPSKAELYDRARKLHIAGRSRMSKAELARVLG